MLNPKFALAAAIIDLLGSVSYAVGTWRGTTKPNRVSWFLWTLVPFIAFAAQINQGVTYQAGFTFAVGFGPLLVLLASFKDHHAYWRISHFDYVCGALSLLAIILWAITKTGNVAIALSVAADGLASVPTIVKAWRHPETESAIAYAVGIMSSLVTLLTLKDWTFAGYGFALYVLFDCLILSVLILFPRFRPAPQRV